MFKIVRRYWQRLRGRQPQPAEQQEEEAAYRHLGEEHAAHGGEQDPEDLHRGRRRLKETFTNHWDLDYLPREELDEALRKEREDH